MGSTSGSFSATKSSKHFDFPLAIDGSSQEPSNVDLQGAMFASWKGLNPWVIDVDAGQDVMSKILEFCEKVPDQAVWVISANGNLSEITFTLPFFDKITYEVIVGTFKTGFKKVTSEKSQWEEKEPTFVVENKKRIEKRK